MITITKVESTDNQRLVEFVLESRRLLFPMLNHSILPKDLANFNDFYIKSTADNAFFQAKNSDNQIVGAICMMGYDDRFPQFQFQENRVVEVARLFVKPEYRREKLGTKLVNELKQYAENQGINLLYLHTHPFLNGAYEFWLKQGFEHLQTTDEQGFETIHMQLKLGED